MQLGSQLPTVGSKVVHLSQDGPERMAEAAIFRVEHQETWLTR